MRHIIKKGDLLLGSAIIVAALITGTFFIKSPAEGKTVKIQVGNALFAEYPLKEDRTVNLKHNTVVIKNGEVFMRDADCPDKVCVNSGKIKKPGEQIICLPNSVVVEVS